MKVDTFVAGIIGIASGSLPCALGFDFFMWQWWVITIPIIILLEVIYLKLKDKERNK